jgi:ribosomal protein S12 methylthiotransferase
LCRFIEEMRFHRLGVFPYSPEEGTSAFVFGDPVPQELKQERLERIMEIQQEISLSHNEARIGETIKVLVESREGEYFVGRSEWDAPEIDQEVLIRTEQELTTGCFYDVKITDAEAYDLFAVI